MATKARRMKDRPLRAHADATRDDIVSAALRLFSERGFDGTSLRDVAQTSGRPLGVVSYHFPSKDLLWRASAERVHRHIEWHFRGLIDTLEGADPKHAARSLMREYVFYFAQAPETFRFMLQIGMVDNERLRWFVESFGKPFRAEFSVMLGELSRQNAIPPDDPRFPLLLYSMIGSAALPFAIAPEVKLTSGIDPVDPDLVAKHANLIVDRFLPESANA